MRTALQDKKRKTLSIRLPSFPKRLAAGLTISILWLLFGTAHLCASGDHAALTPGFVTEFTASTEDVLEALHEVLQDQIIHGTQIFDREPTLTGAVVVESTPLFKPW